ncbi:hypothetical protein [Hymenobacter sp.]|jgi:hypothetical protein|uniref:hypothetical protein n=1 Tax=Hymenobacter sp. TaxID=1898978 RepID=UPI002ED897D9
MTTPAPKTPWYQSRWFWIIGLLVLGLRIGYKAWRQEQRPSYEATMERLNERNESFKEQLRASEAASTAPVITADSALLADTTTALR